MKQRELQTYFVYFKVPAAHSWEKRSAKKGMKKLPPVNRGREIFSEKSGHLVQMQGHAALLAGSTPWSKVGMNKIIGMIETARFAE